MILKTIAYIFFFIYMLTTSLVSSGAQRECDLYGKEGAILTIDLNYKESNSEHHLTWKKNSKILFERRHKINKTTLNSVDDKGNLQLRALTSGSEGKYEVSLFNEEGESLREFSKTLCVLAKPNVTLACKGKEIALTCSEAQHIGLTYEWQQNGRTIPQKSGSKISLPTPEKAGFTCAVLIKGVKVISDEVQSTCKAPTVPGKTSPNFKLFGFEFSLMVIIIAGGGAALLVLVIIVLVCVCCGRSRRQKRQRDEEELRLDLLTQQSHRTCHMTHKPPMMEGGTPSVQSSTDATIPASSRARIKGRGRPPPAPVDDEQPPPLPQPRQKKGPRLERHHGPRPL